MVRMGGSGRDSAIRRHGVHCAVGHTSYSIPAISFRRPLTPFLSEAAGPKTSPKKPGTAISGPPGTRQPGSDRTDRICEPRRPAPACGAHFLSPGTPCPGFPATGRRGPALSPAIVMGVGRTKIAHGAGLARSCPRDPARNVPKIFQKSYRKSKKGMTHHA